VSFAVYSEGVGFKTVKILTIMIVGPQELVPTGAFGVWDYVSCVGYRLDNTLPRWSVISAEVGGVSYQRLGKKVLSIAFIVTPPHSFRLPGWTLGSSRSSV
jgi:hypothetical protein